MTRSRGFFPVLKARALSGARGRLRLLRPFAGVILLLEALTLYATHAGIKFFDIPAGSADRSLKVFAAQSGLDVLYMTESVENIRTQALKGEYTPRQAIDQLLVGTNLVVSENSRTGAMKIRRAGELAEPEEDQPIDTEKGRFSQEAPLRTPGGAQPSPQSGAQKIYPNTMDKNTQKTIKRGKPIALFSALLALIGSSPKAALAEDNSQSVLRTQDAGTVTGRVKNVITDGYLNNARVAIQGTNRVVFSDQSGTYLIPDVPAGTVTLYVSYTGLEAQEVAVQVSPGSTVRLDFSLNDSTTVRLDQFTVAESREMDAMALAINEQRHAPNIKTVVAADAFGDISEGNIGEFLKLMPGVNINLNNDDAFDISLRGFNPEFTPVTMDGNDIANARANIGGVARGGGNLEDVSMSNLSRVEVIKSPIPSMSADFLGGSVNLITKSAFERSTAQLRISGTAQFSSLDYSLSKTHGPGGQMTRKVRPGYDFSYVKPVTENFGFTISSSYSEQYRRIIAPTPTYEFAPAQGGSEASPYLRTFLVREDGRVPIRHSLALGADWRPFNPLTLQFRYRYNLYDLHTAATRLNINTGNNPVAYGADFTQGRTGGAAISHSNIEADAFGGANEFSISGRYQKNWWKADFSAMYSDAGRKYRDVDNGYFQTSVTSIPSASVRYSNINGQQMPSVEVRDASGALVDWRRLENYRITGVRGNFRDSSDEVTSAKLNLRRDFELAGIRSALQVGGSYRERVADIREGLSQWTYLGPDLVANNADNTAAPFVDEHAQVGPKFGVPTEIQFPSNFLLYDRYRSNPEQFVLNESAQFIDRINRSERIIEEITAFYIQGELRLLDNRISVIGGARYERTENTGFGGLRDRAAAYQRDANGDFIRGPNGAPLLITSNALERAKLEYTERGAMNQRSYDNWYPSVSMTYEVQPNLLLRMGYALTLGRPNFTNILPTRDVERDLSEDDGAVGRITARNPALKPWEADNYDVSVEYYFKSSGVVSASVFRKDIINGFGSQTRVVDEELLAEFDLDTIYLGWDLVGTFNVGAPVRITGTELNYQQRLSFLPFSWTKGLSVFVNTTFLDIEGPETNFSTLVKRTANWGFRYSHRRVSLGFNWNYRTSRTLARPQVGPEGVTYFPSMMTVDATSEFRITPKIGLFFNVRNLTNQWSASSKQFSPHTPDYLPFVNVLTGLKFAAGLRATF